MGRKEDFKKVFRQDFSKFNVEVVYSAQDGSCKKCGNALEAGFHRHHVNGDASDNSVSNLELYCAECHRATLGEAAKKQFEEHKAQEKRVLESLNMLIDEIFQGEMSGAKAERAIAALSMSLKVSRRYNEIDKGLEKPPVSIVMARRMAESKILYDSLQEGYREGLKVGVQIRRGLDESEIH